MKKIVRFALVAAFFAAIFAIPANAMTVRYIPPADLKAKAEVVNKQPLPICGTPLVNKGIPVKQLDVTKPSPDISKPLPLEQYKKSVVIPLPKDPTIKTK